MNDNMKKFYSRSNAKPLFSNATEQAEWSESFRNGLKAHIRDNRRRRAMSEMKARTDVRFG